MAGLCQAAAGSFLALPAANCCCQAPLLEVNRLIVSGVVEL
jgi:hypothetical protein